MKAHKRQYKWKAVIEIDQLKPPRLQMSQTEASLTELSEFKISFFFNKRTKPRRNHEHVIMLNDKKPATCKIRDIFRLAVSVKLSANTIKFL